MLRLWLQWRGGQILLDGTLGGRLLPEHGGVQDQAAIMIDAFHVMDAELALHLPWLRKQAAQKRRHGRADE